VPLAGGAPFDVPENVRLLGTMNTADRSIALVDHALRRRFAFFRLQPDYGILRRFHERRATGVAIEGLIEVLQMVNREINDPNYEIGVSFFLDEELDDHLEDIWRMEIEPYLEEFFFDRRPKAEALRWERALSRLKHGFESRRWHESAAPPHADVLPCA
jgi:5-methylcytosine-specific restriction enzyme B